MLLPLSLSLSLTALSQKEGSGCWRRETTTIAFQKNAEWNLHCFMGQRHAQNQPNCALTYKQTHERWNTKQLQTNRTLLCPVLIPPPHPPILFWAKHQTFMILLMWVKTFYSFTEFVSRIIVLFKQNEALKITALRWEEQHEFYSARETYGTDRDWCQLNRSEWYVQKKGKKKQLLN